MERVKGINNVAYSQMLFLMLVYICSMVIVVFPDMTFAATKMLMLNPVRVIFTDRQRTITVSVSNPSKQEISYAISLITARKDASGKYFYPDVETKEEILAKNMIRYSPRRATIAPGKRQLIKLMVRKPKDLPIGEYQTRLELKPIDNPQAAASGGTADNQSINLDVIVVSTFPIVIQHGDIYGDITPKTIKIVPSAKSPSKLAAEVTFNREGQGSGFGNVSLFYTSKSRNRKTISSLQGLSMYIPTTKSTLMIPLKNITREELSAGTLEIVYTPTTGYIGEQLPRRLTAKTMTRTLPLQ